MKKEEVIKRLELKALPKKSKDNSGLCIAKVSRGGIQDYVITMDGRVIVDKGYVSPILEVLEYYPVPVKKEPVDDTPLWLRSESIHTIEEIWQEAHEALVEWNLDNPAPKSIGEMNEEELAEYVPSNRQEAIAYVSENGLTPENRISSQMSNVDLAAAILSK